MAPQVLEHDWWPAGVPTNVEMADRSWVFSSYAFIHYQSRRERGLRIGYGTGIYIHTFFDIGPDGEVDIGDYCCIASPIISTNGRVEIGDYALVSFGVVFADTFDAIPPDARAHREQKGSNERTSPSIVLGPNVWIGARAIILGGAHIGEGAIVGAGSVVDFEVPPYTIVGGNPARIVGQIERRRAS